MPDFDLQSPDGTKYRLSVPEGATQEQILAKANEAKARLGGGTVPENQPRYVNLDPTGLTRIPAVRRQFEDVARGVQRFATEAPKALGETALGAAELVGAPFGLTEPERAKAAVTQIKEHPGETALSLVPMGQTLRGAAEAVASGDPSRLLSAKDTKEELGFTGASLLAAKIPEFAAAKARQGVLGLPGVGPATHEWGIDRSLRIPDEIAPSKVAEREAWNAVRQHGDTTVEMRRVRRFLSSAATEELKHKIPKEGLVDEIRAYQKGIESGWDVDTILRETKRIQEHLKRMPTAPGTKPGEAPQARGSNAFYRRFLHSIYNDVEDFHPTRQVWERGSVVGGGPVPPPGTGGMSPPSTSSLPPPEPWEFTQGQEQLYGPQLRGPQQVRLGSTKVGPFQSGAPGPARDIPPQQPGSRVTVGPTTQDTMVNMTPVDVPDAQKRAWVEAWKNARQLSKRRFSAGGLRRMIDDAKPDVGDQHPQLNVNKITGALRQALSKQAYDPEARLFISGFTPGEVEDVIKQFEYIGKNLRKVPPAAGQITGSSRYLKLGAAGAGLGALAGEALGGHMGAGMGGALGSSLAMAGADQIAEMMMSAAGRKFVRAAIDFDPTMGPRFQNVAAAFLRAQTNPSFVDPALTAGPTGAQPQPAPTPAPQPTPQQLDAAKPEHAKDQLAGVVR